MRFENPRLNQNFYQVPRGFLSKEKFLFFCHYDLGDIFLYVWVIGQRGLLFVF